MWMYVNKQEFSQFSQGTFDLFIKILWINKLKIYNLCNKCVEKWEAMLKNNIKIYIHNMNNDLPEVKYCYVWCMVTIYDRYIIV